MRPVACHAPYRLASQAVVDARARAEIPASRDARPSCSSPSWRRTWAWSGRRAESDLRVGARVRRRAFGAPIRVGGSGHPAAARAAAMRRPAAQRSDPRARWRRSSNIQRAGTVTAPATQYALRARAARAVLATPRRPSQTAERLVAAIEQIRGGSRVGPSSRTLYISARSSAYRGPGRWRCWRRSATVQPSRWPTRRVDAPSRPGTCRMREPSLRLGRRRRAAHRELTPCCDEIDAPAATLRARQAQPPRERSPETMEATRGLQGSLAAGPLGVRGAACAQRGAHRHPRRA